MLGIMEAMAERARGGERLAAGDLAQTIEFLRVFVDKCHHAKEEQLLFPAMRAASMLSAEETIARLLTDHVHGRDAVSHIADAARCLADGDESASAELAEAMACYTVLLRDHIYREERDCFDLADRELPESAQQTLAEGYDRIEREVVGGGVHEGFHALLNRLGAAYVA